MTRESGGTGGAPVHPIGVVAERTGLSTDLIRAWERRYGVVEPSRDEADRRLYTDGDVERLRLLARAVSGGRRIGRVAGLGDEELGRLVRDDEAARRAVSGRSSGGAGERPEALVERALERVLALDPAGLGEVLERAASLLGLPSFLERVVAPLFREVGDEWHAGRLGLVHEHLATGVAMPIVARLRTRLGAAPDAPLVLVGTPVGERHEIGAMMAAAAAAAEGWRVLYLGAEIPPVELAGAARDTGARAVALSVMYADPGEVAREVEALSQALEGEVDLLVGGTGLAALRSALGDGVLVPLEDLDALRSYLRGGAR